MGDTTLPCSAKPAQSGAGTVTYAKVMQEVVVTQMHHGRHVAGRQRGRAHRQDAPARLGVLACQPACLLSHPFLCQPRLAMECTA